MNPLRDAQVRLNRSSRPRWDTFAAHRGKVTQLLCPSDASEQGGRLCVLGSGNCNDLDLGELRNRYREIHLVDLDGEALRAGVARQSAAADASVQSHGDIDVTGVLDRLARWSPRTAIDDADVAALLDAPLRDVRPCLPGAFDVAASTCLLSQLIASVVDAVGEAHPRFVALVQAVRVAHLRLLCDLVAPDGLGVLISDFVSSESFPPLPTVRADQLPSVLGRLIEQRNFFHGVNPAAIHHVFRADEFLRVRVVELQSRSPWLWDLGARVYAVWAMTFHRRSAPSGHLPQG
jgi:hypothetical protein